MADVSVQVSVLHMEWQLVEHLSTMRETLSTLKDVDCKLRLYESIPSA